MNNAERKRPLGLTVFAWLLMIGSVCNMSVYIFEYEWYRGLFNDMPEWLINVRYCCSWALRIVSIGAAIGLLYGKEICRKIVLSIVIFTIATLYWRHPYQAYLNHCVILDREFGGIFTSQNLSQFSFVKLCTASLVAEYALDIIFCGSLFFYLTCPAVKQYFQKSAKST